LALADTKDTKVAESLELQIQHHIKQKQILALRQSHYEKITKNLYNIQEKMAKNNLLQDADNLQVRQLLHLFRVPSNNMDK
jgi:DNA-binding protein H-NS